MQSIQEKVAQAKQAGYSDEEIASYMATLPDYSDKVKTALQAGYKPSEIVSFVSSMPGKTGLPKGATDSFMSSSKPYVEPANMLKGTYTGEALESLKNTARDATVASSLNPLGVAEAGANLISGIASSAYGGLKGLGTVASQMMEGKSFDQATEEATKQIHAAQNAGTYDPRTTSGKVLATAAAAPFMVAKDLTGAAGGKIGEVIGGDKGRIIGETIGDILPDVAGAIAGRGAMTKAATNAVNAVKKAPGAIADKLIPDVQPELVDLAQSALNDHGIPLRADQIAKNSMLKMLGKYAEDIPGAGGNAKERQIAVNKDVGREIGADPSADRITSKVFAQALKKSGEGIGAYAEKNPVNLVESGLDSQFNSILNQFSEKEYPTVASIIESKIQKVRDAAAANDGVITGNAFRDLASDISDRYKATSDGELKFGLSKIEEAMQDALEKQLTGEELADLKKLRYQYAVAKLIEPLIAKEGATGNISPQALLARITSDAFGKHLKATGKAGRIGEIADIGQQFLKEENSSNSAERYLTLGGAGAIGGSLLTGNPLPAAGAIGTWLAARGYNAINPYLARAMVSKLNERVSQQRAENAARNPKPELSLLDPKDYPTGSPINEGVSVPINNLLSLADDIPVTKSNLDVKGVDYTYPWEESPVKNPIDAAISATTPKGPVTQVKPFTEVPELPLPNMANASSVDRVGASNKSGPYGEILPTEGMPLPEAQFRSDISSALDRFIRDASPEQRQAITNKFDKLIRDTSYVKGEVSPLDILAANGPSKLRARVMRQRQALESLGKAQSVDEAISAISQ